MKTGTALTLAAIVGGSALLYHHTKVKELDADLATIHTSIQTQQAQFNQIQTQDSSTFSQNMTPDALQAQLSQFMNQYNQVNSQYVTDLQQYNQFNSQYNQALQQFNQASAQNSQDLQQYSKDGVVIPNLDSLVAQITGYKNQSDTLVKALSLLSDAYGKSKTQLTGVQTQLGKIQSQLSQFNSKNPNADVQIQQQLQTQIAGLQKQVSDEVQKYAAVVTLYQQAQALQGQLQTLQSQVAQLQGQIRSLQAQVVQLQAQIAKLQAASRIDPNYSTSTFHATDGAGITYNPYSTSAPVTAAKTYTGTNSVGTTSTYQELPDGTYKIVSSSNPNAVGMLLNYGQVMANLDKNVTVGTAPVASMPSTTSTGSAQPAQTGHYETRQVQTGTHQVCTTQQVPVNHATYHATFYPWTDVNGHITPAHYGPPGSYGAPYWTTYESKQVCHDEPTYTTQQVWVPN